VAEPAVVYLATLQFHADGVWIDESAASQGHLVRGTLHGTPGDALCGLPRFVDDGHGNSIGPGFSVGGGTFKPFEQVPPCPGCAEVAARDFPGLPIMGSPQTSSPLALAIQVRWKR
jgi:hypothetical protein